jgi:hypothetical protein
LAEKEAFELRYIPSIISLRRVFEKIEALGEERNQPFKGSQIPQV